MASAKHKHLYHNELQGSVLETVTVLSDVLRPAGYSKDVINDIAISTFIDNERSSIKSPSNMHLIALKKTLLYAIPVIAPSSSTSGILLTSRVSSPAIRYDPRTSKSMFAGIASGDKFRLVGLSFPNVLINHLSMDVFPFKYFNKLNIYPSTTNISSIDGIQTKSTSVGTLFIIKPKDYENVTLYNQINKVLAFNLINRMEDYFVSKELVPNQSFIKFDRLNEFNALPFIDSLNKVLSRQVDKTFSMSLFESLHMTANWLLSDQITLLGFESVEVQQQLKRLQYVKEQNQKVLNNIRMSNQNQLLSSRAEKIAREKYPFYFDYTDRRSVFGKFYNFDLLRLPKPVQQEIQLLLKKELDMQEAILNNTCEHLQSLNSFTEYEKYINYDKLTDDGMYECKLCAYPLVCIHQVELQEAIHSIKNNANDSDQRYVVQQKIINKYKSTSQRRHGTEDTEVSFTFYCKFCGEEIGKSDDNIQSVSKSNYDTAISMSDSNDISIYSSVYSIVQQHMNADIVPSSKKQITKLIYNEITDDVKRYALRANKMNLSDVDIIIRYISSVFALAALISLNQNKIKSKENILQQTIKQQKEKVSEVSRASPVEGGAQLKDEFVTALKIIQADALYRQIGITDDKIKSLLIEAYKNINIVFSNESYQLKAKSPKDHLIADIISGPLASYALYMKRRVNRKSNVDVWSALGIDIDALTKSKAVPTTHALYKNIFIPTTKENNDHGRYILESYKASTNVCVEEPINKKYISVVTPPLSDFIVEYQKKQNSRLQLKRSSPQFYLPVENSREYDFVIKNYHLVYCLKDETNIRPHRWIAHKQNNHVRLICKYCNTQIDKTSKSNNELIDERLNDQMMKEAFFELYTISCPIKDGHEYVDNACKKCNGTKQQLSSMSDSYYKKYMNKFTKHKDNVTLSLLSNAEEIINYMSVYVKSNKVDDKPESVDTIKLTSLLTNLSKLYKYENLINIGKDSFGNRSLELVSSFVQMLYSHYNFVKNLSKDSMKHPDSSFMTFVKKHYFDGHSPKKTNLSNLPEYPQSSNADKLLLDLLTIIFDLSSKGHAVELIRFIMNKIIQQHEKRQAFNFAKLKSINVTTDDNEMEQTYIDDDADDEEYNVFDGYDMSEEDLEDNMDGDYD